MVRVDAYTGWSDWWTVGYWYDLMAPNPVSTLNRTVSTYVFQPLQAKDSSIYESLGMREPNSHEKNKNN